METQHPNIELFNNLEEYLSDFEKKEYYFTEDIYINVMKSIVKEQRSGLPIIYTTRVEKKPVALSNLFRLVKEPQKDNKNKTLYMEMDISRSGDLVSDFDYFLMNSDNVIMNNCKKDLSMKIRVGDYQIPYENIASYLPMLNIFYQDFTFILECPYDYLVKNPELLSYQIIVTCKEHFLDNHYRGNVARCRNFSLGFPHCAVTNGIFGADKLYKICHQDVKMSRNLYRTEYGLKNSQLGFEFVFPKYYESINMFSVTVKDIQGNLYNNLISRISLSFGETRDFQSIINNEQSGPLVLKLEEDLPNGYIIYQTVSLSMSLFQPLKKDQYISLQFMYQKDLPVIREAFTYLDQFIIDSGMIHEEKGNLQKSYSLL